MRAWIGRAMFVVALAAGPAQAMSDAELQAIVEKRFVGDRTGACVAVAVIAETVATAYVCADPANPRPIDAATAFEIGSVSKTMAAALLADMILKGEVTLDDTLASLLPPGSVVPDFNGQPILLRHVVTHTSALPVIPPIMASMDPVNPYATVNEEMLLLALAQTTLTRAPGSQSEYSNFAMMVLSVGIAHRSGTDFETLLSEKLFKPLDMSGSYVTRLPDSVRAAPGHLSTGAPTSAWDFQVNLSGVGGVRATLPDMIRYVEAQLGRIESPIFPAIALTQEQVSEVGGDRFGMNWGIRELSGHDVRAHEGGTGGFSSLVAFDRDRGRGVVVLSDTALTALGGLSDLGIHLIDPIVPLGHPRLVMAAPAELLDALVGQFRFETGLSMVVTRGGDTLFIQATGQAKFQMGYDSAGDFYPLAFDALLRPKRMADGSYAFTWFQLGAAIAAERVGGEATRPPFPKPDLQVLRAYEGEYPLNPQFSLQVFEREGELMVQGSGQEAIPVVAVAADIFVADSVGAEIVFERDAGGNVVALTLKQSGQIVRAERR